MTKKGNHTKLKDSLEKLVQAQKSLEEAIALPVKHDRDLAGIIQSFEFVYELAWKTLKRLLEALGHRTDAARDVFKTAYKVNILSEEKVWLDILEDRNKTSHTYDKKMAEELVAKIKSRYAAAFHDLVNGIKQRVESLLGKGAPNAVPLKSYSCTENICNHPIHASERARGRTTGRW